MTLAEAIALAERELADATRGRRRAHEEARSILARAQREGRLNLTVAESDRVNALLAERDRQGEASQAASDRLASFRAADQEEREMQVRYQERRPGAGPVADDEGPPPFIRLADGRRAAVNRGQRFAAHPVVSEYAAARSRAEEAVIGQHGSIGNLLRAMTTTSGSAVVPTVWAGEVIDRARNLAAVLRAGADIIPMDAKTVQIGRLTADPQAAFRAEGSLITASDPTFDNVTLEAKTMSALVIGSLEWFQDAPNVDDIVTDAIARAVALKLDEVALFGGLTTGNEGFNLATPPNPRGVLAALLATAASSVLGGVANGTAQTALSYWNEVISTIFTPRSFNEAPNALIWNAKLAQQYAMAYDSTGQPLQLPPAVGEVERFVSNQVPSFTSGTMTGRATDLFVGDFRQLLIGQRLDMRIETLTERYAEFGQVGIVAHWRGDVQLARPRAFAVYRYLQGAA